MVDLGVIDSFSGLADLTSDFILGEFVLTLFLVLGASSYLESVSVCLVCLGNQSLSITPSFNGAHTALGSNFCRVVV